MKFSFLLPILAAHVLGACLLFSCGRGGGTQSSVVGSGAWVKEIEAAEFDAFRKQGGVVAIVDFHAPWCGPCRQLGPLLEEIAKDHNGAVRVAKVNVDRNRELAAREGVRGIPDLRMYINGVPVDKLVGVPPADELRQRIEGHLRSLRASNPNAGASGSVSSLSSTGSSAQAPADPTPGGIHPMPDDWMPSGIERR